MDDLLQRIADYGYPGLFFALFLGIVGLPIPDETLLVFFGYLASTGKISLILTWLTAYLGSTVGITISYWLGKGLGHSVVLRYGRYVHFTEQRLHQIQSWFERIGHWLLAVGYYIPGVRHFTALVAGISETPFSTFAPYAYTGAAVWVSTFLGFGYLVGDRWEKLFDVMHRNLLVTLGVALVAGWVVWKIKRRPKKP